MASGKLSQRLIFQQRISASDDYGNEQAGFVDEFTEWAEFIIPSLGSETVTAARLIGRQPITIRVRRNSRTVQIQHDWRAVDENNPGIVYALTAPPVDRTQRRQYLEMTADLEVGGAGGEINFIITDLGDEITTTDGSPIITG